MCYIYLTFEIANKCINTDVFRAVSFASLSTLCEKHRLCWCSVYIETSENLIKDKVMNDQSDKETYYKIRQSYDDAELEVSGRYDKWILTLSGGALGLSITFIEKIAKNPTPETLFWLKLSWGCLVISLLSALLSLVTSQSAIRENRKELDIAYSEKRDPNLGFPRWFTNFTNVLNWGSLFLFIVGVIFLCVFSFKNIDQKIKDGGNSYGKKTTQTASRKAPEGKDRERIRSTASPSEGRTRIRPATASTEKEEIINDAPKGAALKKNRDEKAMTNKK